MSMARGSGVATGLDEAIAGRVGAGETVSPRATPPACATTWPPANGIAAEAGEAAGALAPVPPTTGTVAGTSTPRTSLAWEALRRSGEADVVLCDATAPSATGTVPVLNVCEPPADEMEGCACDVLSLVDDAADVTRSEPPGSVTPRASPATKVAVVADTVPVDEGLDATTCADADVALDVADEGATGFTTGVTGDGDGNAAWLAVTLATTGTNEGAATSCGLAPVVTVGPGVALRRTSVRSVSSGASSGTCGIAAPRSASVG